MSIGIDIGSKTIKAVEIAFESGKYVFKTAGIIPAPPGIGIDHLQDDKDYASLAETIKKLFKDAKFTSKDVSVALSESQVFTRPIKLPLLTDQEIASAIKWQAEESVPIPINETIVQHVIIERKENTTPPEVLVLLVAAPRVLVEKYVKVLTLAGLNVVGAETELIAMTRALAPANQSSVIVDFGARSTDIAIAKNAQLVFSRTIPTAGEAFTRAVSQAIGVDVNQAEEYKKTYGLSQNQLEGKIGNAISPVFRVVTEEIKKSIHFYQTDQNEPAPTLIILSGGTAGLPDAGPTITKLVGIETQIANPFAKLAIEAGKLNALSNYAPLYSVAIGLALRGD